MPTVPGGYYIKARKIRDSEIAHCAPVVREIWDYILREVNHTDNPKSGIKRGQLFTSYPDMMEALHWYVGYRKETYSKTQCERATKVLTNMGMVTTTRTTRGIVITVCKYDTYANPRNYEDNTEGFTNDLRTIFPDNTIQDNEYKNNKNKEIDTKVSVETDVSMLQELYKNIEKNKKSIIDFITENKPKFYQPYFDMWNLFASEYGFPKLQLLNDTRKRKLRTRLNDKNFDFIKVLGAAAKSEGLQDRQWFNFDWIIKNDTNYAGVLEGKYKKSFDSKPNAQVKDEDGMSYATKELIGK